MIKENTCGIKYLYWPKMWKKNKIGYTITTKQENNLRKFLLSTLGQVKDITHGFRGGEREGEKNRLIEQIENAGNATC